MKEIWKNIKGYEELYQVSNLGRVKSLERYRNFYCYLQNKNCKSKIKSKILKQVFNGNKYYTVGLCKNSKCKTKTVHRLVAETFIPNPDNLPQINHIDGNKQNNCVNNLEWCTQSENTIHAIKTGLLKVRKGKDVHFFGKKGKLSFVHKEVIQYDKNGNFIKEWESITEASQKLNLQISNISKCCSGGLKTTGGYIWKYKGDEI